MPWFKVDDKLHDHRKARAAGKAAMGVWVLAGSWAADNLTDGFVPVSILPRWGNSRDAAKLCQVGLWMPDEQDGERGWRFHEWTERQPTRAKTLAERSEKAAAGRAGGLASGRSRREAKAKQDASGLVEPPTRPDPSVTPGGVTSLPRKRGTRLPDEFIPTEKSRATIIAEFPSLDLRKEHARFVDYWTAKPGKDGVKLDWDATWRNWMRRAGDDVARKPRSRQQETDDLFARAMARAEAADRGEQQALEGEIL